MGQRISAETMFIERENQIRKYCPDHPTNDEKLNYYRRADYAYGLNPKYTLKDGDWILPKD